jgi:hypothetical protein
MPATCRRRSTDEDGCGVVRYAVVGVGEAALPGLRERAASVRGGCPVRRWPAGDAGAGAEEVAAGAAAGARGCARTRYLIPLNSAPGLPLTKRPYFPGRSLLGGLLGVRWFGRGWFGQPGPDGDPERGRRGTPASAVRSDTWARIRGLTCGNVGWAGGGRVPTSPRPASGLGQVGSNAQTRGGGWMESAW